MLRLPTPPSRVACFSTTNCICLQIFPVTASTFTSAPTFEANSPFNLVLIMAVITHPLWSSGFSLWQVKWMSSDMRIMALEVSSQGLRV